MLPRTRPGARYLVVDDEEPIRRVGRPPLEQGGLSVRLGGRHCLTGDRGLVVSKVWAIAAPTE
jgi:CheY-like chemotaxis protein